MKHVFFIFNNRKEIRDIRRQIKHNIGANKQQHTTDRAITTTNKTKVKKSKINLLKKYFRFSIMMIMIVHLLHLNMIHLQQYQNYNIIKVKQQ